MKMAPVVRAAVEELGFPDPHPEGRGRQARDLSDLPVTPNPNVNAGTMLAGGLLIHIRNSLPQSS